MIKNNIPTESGSGYIALNKKYPISRMVLVKRILPYLCILSIIFLLPIINIFLQFSPGNNQPLNYKLYEFYWVFIVGLLLKVIYEELFRLTYGYGIDSDQLVISKGIILKNKGCFPVGSINDIYLKRSMLDLILGLYHVHICTPSFDSREFAHIEGLSAKTAVRLQRHLAALIKGWHQRQVGNELDSSTRRLRRPRRKLRKAQVYRLYPALKNVMEMRQG